MGPRTAAGFGFIDEAGVGVAYDEHVTGAVCDTIIGVGGDVVQELGAGVIGIFGCGGLLRDDVT